MAFAPGTMKKLGAASDASEVVRRGYTLSFAAKAPPSIGGLLRQGVVGAASAAIEGASS